MKKYSVLTLFVMMALLLSGCAKKYSTEMTVDVKEFVYTPTEFTIPAGEEVTLNITNSGSVEHEFVIMKYGKEVSVPFGDDDEDNIFWEVEVLPGGSESVTFTAPSDIGEYQVICGIPGHVEGGMIAKLFVVAP